MRAVLAFLLAVSASAATFGTAVGVVGGATDIVLDEARGRLYVVNNTQRRVDVYSTAQPRLLSSIPVGLQPLSAALSRNGRSLYVTAYGASALEVVDVEQGAVVRRVGLPAAPEAVAVGIDGRVLITTVGSGTNNADNRLLLFDPANEGPDPLAAVPSTLPAPAAPQFPAPSSRVFMSTRSSLRASADGRFIIGLNNPNATSRQIFVFEATSGTVLRSRTVTSISNVLSVAPDGSRFMAGLSLFDTETLAIVAQQNAANAMFPFANNVNFNTQQNQGGSIFSPDGTTLYSAFNIAPVNSTQANVTQLMLSDPENLLIRIALQLPENLAGKMVITSDGGAIYALSQSGFLAIPVSRMYDSPIALVDQPVALVLNDQCGVTRDQSQVEIRVRNGGRGNLTASAQLLQTGTTFTTPLAGGGGAAGGAGGGPPGVQIPIPLPGGGQILIPPGVAPGGGGAGGGQGATPVNNVTQTQQNAVAQSAPSVRTRREGSDTVFTISFNSNAARSLGTITPADFVVQSPEAINVPSRIRVYQNNRNAESRGTVVAAPVSVSTAEGLTDIVLDSERQRLYVTNSGLNRVEVVDTATNTLLEPIPVGQLPRSLAMTPDRRFLYVANTGGESISIIGLEEGRVTGKVRFPPAPYNASFALNTPSLLAATAGGVQVVMSDGRLWKVVNNEALPRPSSPVIGTTTIAAPRSLAATPEGEYALLLGGTGTAYLYDAMTDDFVLSQSVVSTPVQGYFGPLAAGPRGQYYVVNGRILNSTLTPVGSSTITRPVAAVAAVSATMIARFSQPVRANTTAVVRDVPTVELVDVAIGATRGLSPALEGPLSVQTGTQRVNVSGRTMAIDTARNVAYILSASGISVVPVAAGAAASPIRQTGVASAARGQAAVAPGSLIDISGQNLAADALVSRPPFPTRLGGVCVTVDESPIPLLMTSAGRITAQLPATLSTGNHSIAVRSIDRNIASAPVSFAVSKYAPAVLADDTTGQAAIYRADGTPVTNRNKANRDELLTLYAIGLGATSGPKITAGEPAPEDAESEPVQVFVGNPQLKQSEMIVEWSGLAPGLAGIYRLDVRVPGFHTAGESLPVTLKIGGVTSPAATGVAPTTALN
jgi:uncharacterized protein (TIGR03437 family)